MIGGLLIIALLAGTDQPVTLSVAALCSAVVIENARVYEPDEQLILLGDGTGVWLREGDLEQVKRLCLAPLRHRPIGAAYPQGGQ